MDPYRSLLFVPVHREGWAKKGADAGADALILDLEDSVPEADKIRARAMLPEAIAEARAARPGVGILVRPNHWSTEHGPADLEAIASSHVDGLLAPKVDDVGEVVRLDAVLDYLERSSRGGRSPMEMVASLETARGLVNRDSIAVAPRIAGMLGAAARDGDVARSVGFRWSQEGRETLHLRSGVVLACRAAVSCHPIVGIWQDVHDLEGLRGFADANRDLGFRGQVILHPSHVAPVNEAYTPSKAEVAFYQGMIGAYDRATEEGHGAVIYEGEHIDQAHVSTAREIVEFARRISQLNEN